jgi:signal transduction histidine kinase/CheY-like chemotaxis protein
VFLSTKSPLRDERGEVIGVVVLGTDVTDRRRAEHALRRSEEQLRLAVRAADMMAFEWDIEAGRFTRLGESPAAAALPHERRVADVLQRVHPEDRRAVLARVRAVLRRQTDLFVSEHRFRERLDAGWRWLRVHGRIAHDAQGRPRTMLGLALDITAQKEASVRIEGLLDDLREADRRKDAFLATLAHELRNPLAPLRNALEIQRLAGNDPARARSAQTIMDRQLRQMVRLLDDLLDVSRITRNRLELRREAVELAAVLGQAVETVRPHIEARRQQLSVSLPDRAVLLHADLTRLAQVFSNLLDNASKYTPAGGSIEIAARAASPGEIAVTVKDEGVGITAGDLPRLFDMFYRAGSAGPDPGGVGIGLSLARGLVELHGGAIDAYSDGPLQGAQFRVRLPVMADAPRSIALASDPDALPVLDQPCRIVLADDNVDGGDSLCVLLRLAGAQVHLARDGADALRAIESARPDVAVLDIGMPEMDGYEVARRVRASEQGGELRLIALTGYGQDEDRRRALEAGFDAHLVKPVEPRQLLAVIGRLTRTAAEEGQRGLDL